MSPQDVVFLLMLLQTKERVRRPNYFQSQSGHLHCRLCQRDIGLSPQTHQQHQQQNLSLFIFPHRLLVVVFYLKWINKGTTSTTEALILHNSYIKYLYYIILVYYKPLCHKASTLLKTRNDSRPAGTESLEPEPLEPSHPVCSWFPSGSRWTRLQLMVQTFY